MNSRADIIANRVDPLRIKQLTLDLVRIPSPPYQEGPASEYYARYLNEIGLEVELDYEYPTSPSVIGRLSGISGGTTIQLDGHIDHIANPGPAIEYRDGYIYGRGSEDMKASLAAMAEAVRVIKEAGVRLKGNVLLTAHGRHESNTNETLNSLIAKGVHGDAVIVTELGGDKLPIAGMGMAFWELRIHRDGDVFHETIAPRGTPHPIEAIACALDLLRDRANELAATDYPYLGSDSIFLGRVASGDYYNRLPTEAVIAGTRRFAPPQKVSQIQDEFTDIARRISQETGAHVEAIVNGGNGFHISENEPLVKAVQRAHRRVTGKDLPLAGTRVTANAPNFIHGANVPALYYGVSYLTAHSDYERVELAEIVRACKVYVHIILDFLGYEEG